MEHRFGRNLKLGFSFSFFMLTGVGLLCYFAFHQLMATNSWVSHSNAVISKLERSLSLMKDAETGQRGYLLTGHEKFLEPYHGAYQRALGLVNDAAVLTSDNISQQHNIAAIRLVMEKRMTILQQLIDKRQKGMVINDTELEAGKVAMDALRRAVEKAETDEHALLAKRAALLDRYSFWTPILIVGAIVVAFTITLIFYIRVVRDINEKDHLRAELQEKEQETAAFNEELTAANEEITAANEELNAINQELMAARSDLAAMNNSLEEKVAQRTAVLLETEAELQAINEEMSAANEELLSTNEELHKSRESLRELVCRLEASESRARDIVAYAPFPIGVYAGRNMRIVMANKAIIDVWNKGTDVIGKTYQEVLPELAGQNVFEQLDNVFLTGEPFHARNQRVDLMVEGHLQPFYFNYSFTALRGADGSIYGVMNTAAEITDMVLAKQQTEKSETELREIKKQLEAELAISQQVERQKDDFIGMASHELKTPLTSLSAMIQVTQSKLKNSGDPFLAQAMDKATIQVRRMIGMINGFLNISRLESGMILIEKQEFDLDELINEVLDEVRLTGTGHQLVYNSAGPLNIQADRDKISSVISNLVGNAVKYSPKNCSVFVNSFIDANKEIIISVRDEGMGVKTEDIDKIFDRYYRVKSEHTQHIAGFGIGLYLSAEIVKRHNGRIWVESTIGVGSTFNFSLPLA